MKWPHRLAREASFFFCISLAGLASDFAVFYFLTHHHVVETAIANFISGWVGLTIVYALSSGLLYKRRYTIRMYGIFLAYYCLSIGFFSFLVAYLQNHVPLSAMVAKALTLPLSFSCNFLFNKLCLGRKRD